MSNYYQGVLGSQVVMMVFLGAYGYVGADFWRPIAIGLLCGLGTGVAISFFRANSRG